MVFESVVVEVLNKILGDYVENLDSKQLSLGIWGGDVVLQNLVLKQSALDDLDAPIQIVYGRLGKLVLKIPWKNLYGAPVEAHIEKLFLLVVPHQQVKYNAEKEEKHEFELKQAHLKRIEEAKKKAEEMGKPKEKVDDTFVEKLTTQIIKNVQVKINDIHIRYEDSITNPGQPFAFGVTLSNLSVETTNAEWQPGLADDKATMIYKILNLEALSAYWNCSCPLYSKSSVDDIIRYCEESIATKTKKIPNYHYVLGPINASARLRLFPKPENDEVPFSTPKVLLNLEMEKLSIGLNRSQFKDILLMADSMNRLSRALPYRKYRPNVNSYKGHYKEWWKFAYTCILEEEVRRNRRNWDWNHIKNHRLTCKTYASAYETKLRNKKTPENIKTLLVECEKKLDLTNLVIIRQRIQMEVNRLEKETEKKKKNAGWFGSWWGSSATDDDLELKTTADLMKKFQEAMNSDEKDKLYRAIDYQENSAPAEYPEDYIATKCAFVLRCLEVQILDDTQRNKVILTTELRDVNCGLQQRPAMSAITVAVKVDQFTVNGMPQGDVLPQMVTTENFTEGGILLDIFFETNPLDRECDQRLQIRSQPIIIMYDAQTIIQLTNIFQMPEALTLENIQEAAVGKLQNIKEFSTTGMQHMIDQHTRLDINIQLFAPCIIVPHTGLYSSHKSVVVVDLGEVEIKTQPRVLSVERIKELQKIEGSKAELLEELISDSYDKFVISLSNLQVIIANKDEVWRTCLQEKTISSMHILQPVSLIMNIHKCILPDDPRLPKMKVNGQLPNITINMCEERILSLIALIASIPLPGGEEPVAADNISQKSSLTSLLSYGGSMMPLTDRAGKHAGASSIAKSTVDYDAVQTTDLEAKFEMKELVLIVSKSNVGPALSEEKLIEFRCMMLEVEMIKQQLFMDVSVRLGGIGLTHYRSVKTVEIIKTPMSSGGDEYLFTVHFMQINKKHPEFYGKFGSCEQRLDLNFSTLQLQLHQQSLQELLFISSDFQYALNDITSNTTEVHNVLLSKETSSAGTTSTAKQRMLDVAQYKNKQIRSRKSTKIVMETIMFRLNAKLDELDLLISNDRRSITNFAVKGIATEIILKKLYTQISATLADLVILDMNPDSIHSKVLYKTDTSNVLDVQIVTYNKVHGIENNTDVSVSVAMSCIRITFLNLFVSSVLDFLNKFQQAQAALKEATTAAAETAKLNMKNAYESATRIKFIIDLKAPVIIIPVNSTSYDGFILDLGYIQLNNNLVQLEVISERGEHALVDDIKLYLKDMKMSRILLDNQLQNKVECVLLKPITFLLKVKRNLTISWYKKIPEIDVVGELKSVELKLSECDYSKLLLTLSENIGEAEMQTKMVDVKPSEHRRQMRRQNVVTSIQEEQSESTEKLDEQVYPSLRFTFAMESFIITLFRRGTETLVDNSDCDNLNHAPENGLARITLLVFSLKGRILTDNSITTSILLIDCLLDDIRVGREGKITRLMERKEDETEDSSYNDPLKKSMIDITFQQKQLDMFVDVRVCGFNLILSMDYLTKVSAFFTPPKPTKMERPKSATVQHSKPYKPSEEVQTYMTINLKIEKPDIILVEIMDDINTNALILNNEMLFNVRLSNANQTIRGSINDLQLYTCCFNPKKRKETMYPVLRPCNIVVVGATPLGQGLHVDVIVSEIYIAISPAVIELLNCVYQTMYAVENTDCDCEDQSVTYYSNLWDTVPFNDADFWFLKTEEGQDAMELVSKDITSEDRIRVVEELCNFSIKSVTITVESGVGKKTLPMLMIESKFESAIHNWSSKLSINGILSLQMEYYNQGLALWEPLIEPVETLVEDKLEHNPWQLKIELKMNESQEEQSVVSPTDSEIEEVQFTPPALSIFISSNVNLELVITKTLLEVLSLLGKAFSCAITQGIPVQETNKAPYRFVNDTGTKITVNLSESRFKLYNPEKATVYRDIVLESGTEIQLDTTSPMDKSFSTAALCKSMSSIGFTHSVSEIYLYVEVNDMKCSLKIPVLRAVKRYFPLNYRENNENWGVISDVTVEGAETIITLRSILQVHNHFDQPVNIYYMTNRGNELEIIKRIPPNSDCNIPMNAAYTLTSELFLSVEGHCVSASPFVWKDLQHNLTLVKELMCPNIKNKNQGFIIKACGDIEQVFFAETTKHTMASTCYNIHLRPAIKFRNCLPITVICIVEGNVIEKTVKAGEEINLPDVNPGSANIVIRLPNYLEKEWSCRQLIPAVPTEFTVWSFDSHDSIAKMVLDLGMHCSNKYGTRILCLYCPFWMLNKTGLMLSYRNHDDINILHHPEDFSQQILFSFNAKNFFGKKKASIKVGTGEWSDKFSLDVSGSSGTVVCKANSMIYRIGVHNQLTYNGLTKQVTFTPYYVLVNNAPFAIECQELERPADPWISIEPNTCTPLWPRSERDDKLLKVKIGGTTELSAPFLITEVHTSLLKIPNKYGAINVDVQITEVGVYVTFSEYNDGLAPALIINHTNHDLYLWEKESVNVKILPSKHKFLQTWENPTGPRLIVWQTEKKAEQENELRKDELGEFSLDTANEKIFWVSFLNGLQRILLFTESLQIAADAHSAGDFDNVEQEITVSIFGIGLSLINNITRQEIMYVAIASSGVIWEVSKMNSNRYKPLSVKECILMESAYQEYLHNNGLIWQVQIDAKTEVDFQNLLMLRPHKRRIRRGFQTGLWLQMKTSPHHMQLHAKINRVQIDNQMYDSIFPVILAPVPPPKTVAADSSLKPFAELSIVQRIMKHSSIQQYKYFKVLIQEFHVKVDLGFINALTSIFEGKEQTPEEIKQLFLKDMELVAEPLQAHVISHSQQEQKNFYDLLHFSPLKVHVSFSLATSTTASTASATQTALPEFLSVILQGVGVTLTDVNDIVFRIAYFERDYSFLSQKQLVGEATSHYVGQAIKQMYVLVLGLDVLGNPFGLVLGITKGVEDLFYEPFQGAIQGPGEFAEGLALGVRSLFGHTVGGAAGAVSKITGAMGKGIAALTFDKDYQRKRRNQINKKPANIQEGIARGGKGLVMGVVDGVTGVFTKPISGAKEQGVEGFFKGIGKGAVGLVTRPAAGVIDFASGSLDAVKRATEMGEEVNRVRAPRYIALDSVVRPYVKNEAEGFKLIRELEKGKYVTTDTYEFHTWIIEGKDILLLTDKRIAYVVRNEIFGGWQVEWSYTWPELKSPAKIVDRGVQIQVTETKKKVLGLFGSADNGKIIIIADKKMKEFVKEKIESLRVNA